MKKLILNLLQTSIIIGAVLFSVFFCTDLRAQQGIKPEFVGSYKIGPNQFDEKKEREIMKKDGLSPAVIDALIAERKVFMKNMKNVHKAEQNVLKTGPGAPPVPFACSDLGVENGWSTWAGAPGVTNGVTGIPTLTTAVSPPVSVSPQTCFNITSGAGIDPCTPGVNPATGAAGPPLPVVAPGFGSASIQIGCPMQVNCYAEQLTFNFTPTAADKNLVYTYAVVIYDPGSSHSVTERPFCEFMILAPNGDTVPCSYQKYVAAGGSGLLPGFFDANASCVGGANTSYKPWTTVGVNLTNYIGQNLTIKITNVDCSQCGHYAHSYWDFQCGPVPLAAGCVGNQSTIMGPTSDPASPYTYQWYQNNVAIPGATSQSVIVTPAANDTFAVQVSQPSGCNFYLTYAPAIVTPDFNYTGQCGNYVFTDSSFATPSTTASITQWNWSFPGGTPSTANTATANVTYPPGNYTASLTITSSAGCSATIAYPLAVGGFPTAAVVPSTPCLGVATTLTDASVAVQGDPISTWNWSMPGGTPATATTQNTSTTYGTAGVHTVTLVVTSTQGCKDTITQQVIVYTPPVANFIAPDSGCAPVCQIFTDASTSTDGNVNAWQWTFPGGAPGTASGSATTPSVCYYTPGTYSVSLIVTTNYGCKDTISLPMIEVYPWPTADFCVAPTVQPTTNPVFNFCDMWSSDVVQWSWNFGDNDSDLTSTDPVHSYSATANANDFYYYNICIRVENQHGCWDTTCKVVELIPEYTFYIPNTFTPNGDFMNEFFYGKGRGIKEYNIWLFDRWGNQIWDCHKEDKNTNWDSDVTVPKQEGLSSFCKWDGVVVKGGVDMGGGSKQLAQEDVYVWKVRLTDIFDKKHMYVGHVNIVR